MKKIIVCAAVLAATLSAAAEDKVVIPSGYERMVFCDEFDTGSMPDTTKWVYEKGYLRNGEMQYYTVGRKDNCYIEDGKLHLTARNDSATIDGKVRPVTSTSLVTHGKHSWKYCYVEVRAKLPASLGTWPAIWMMPENSVYGSWPRSGEIDIMEHVGYNPRNIHYSIHSYKYNHVKNTQKTHWVVRNDAAGEYHTFAFEWKENRMSWILDGQVQYTVVKDEDGWEAWPFDQNFYLILNLAFGGGWGGQQGVNLNSLPQHYVIDYVRIFQ